MPELNDEDRKEIWRDFMHSKNRRLEPFGNLLKADIRDAVNAVDVWVNDNAANFNNAVPLPARTELTKKQKAELLVFVIKKRFERT